MTTEEKAIREREAATAYVRSTVHKDVTALIVLLDKERARSAAMLAALFKARDALSDLNQYENDDHALLNEIDIAISTAAGR